MTAGTKTCHSNFQIGSPGFKHWPQPQLRLSLSLLRHWIQIGQWRTARIKLKLDLFQERFQIFSVIEQINRAGLESRGDEWVGEFLSRMNDAVERLRRFRLLFPIQIGTRVDEIVDAWHDFSTLKAEGEGIPKPSQAWSDNLKNRRQLWENIGERNKSLRKEIENFIRIDWKG